MNAVFGSLIVMSPSILFMLVFFLLFPFALFKFNQVKSDLQNTAAYNKIAGLGIYRGNRKLFYQFVKAFFYIFLSFTLFNKSKYNNWFENKLGFGAGFGIKNKKTHSHLLQFKMLCRVYFTLMFLFFWTFVAGTIINLLLFGGTVN